MTPIPELDPILHFPKRMMIMAILYTSAVVDFGFLKDQLELSDSDLSKQMTTLADAGYVKVSKTGHGRSGNTTYNMTRAGKKAYKEYRARLAKALDFSE